MLPQQSIYHPFFSSLVYVNYSVVSGQYWYTITTNSHTIGIRKEQI